MQALVQTLISKCVCVCVCVCVRARACAVLWGSSALYCRCTLAGGLCPILSPLFDQQSIQACSHGDGRYKRVETHEVS